MNRVYLDWNATAPLRSEARTAMLEAMDLVGNPSSVHSEGRAAKGVVEKARGQVARLVGCDPSEVVFTSGATEAAALALGGGDGAIGPPTEHDCVHAWAGGLDDLWDIDETGQVAGWDQGVDDVMVSSTLAVATANGETGIVTEGFVPGVSRQAWLREHKGGFVSEHCPGVLFRDAVQSIGKLPVSFTSLNADFLTGSSHKIGGPKGVGALVVAEGAKTGPVLRGGGQEMGRRSGTENVIGIAGFGAAAEVAQRDLETGVWAQLETLRDNLEDALYNAAPETIFFGKDAPRLPNTSCFAVPGWKGETQVMQMDLAGYAISAGSACSSGKVKESRVLRAMGFDSVTASSAIRVSIGPATTEDEVMGFARTWMEHYRRWKQRAA